MRCHQRICLIALGLPIEHAEQFVDWVRAIFGGLSGVDQEGGARAQGEVLQYFGDLLDQRRSQPKDPDVDMATYMLNARIDGEPISQEYLLSMLSTLVLAGLDTTKCQLGYNFFHLATHPDGRHRLVENPDLIPSAIEELLRFADRVILDRQPNRHIAFGAGPHRCAGAHLARRELLIAMEEWHRRIPEYWVASDEPLVEHGWQLGLDHLPLAWPP